MQIASRPDRGVTLTGQKKRTPVADAGRSGTQCSEGTGTASCVRRANTDGAGRRGYQVREWRSRCSARGAIRPIAPIVNQVIAPMGGNCDDGWMGLWIVIAVVLLFWGLSRADARNRSNLPKRAWNLWIGPKPREGEGRARFTLRRALAAALALGIVSTPLFLISAPPDEGPDFSQRIREGLGRASLTPEPG